MVSPRSSEPYYILYIYAEFSRAMLHDQTIYPDPFTFNPDRFMKNGHLNPDVRDPGHATFGFGRRYTSLVHCHTY
jgi:hypothetical protein